MFTSKKKGEKLGDTPASPQEWKNINTDKNKLEV